MFCSKDTNEFILFLAGSVVVEILDVADVLAVVFEGKLVDEDIEVISDSSSSSLEVSKVSTLSKAFSVVLVSFTTAAVVVVGTFSQFRPSIPVGQWHL